MAAFSTTRKYNPGTDIPDLTGKVALVTGGNTGIGYHTVTELVRHGAKVYMGARNEGRATGAIARMKAEGVLDTGSGQVVWLELDLSTPASTKLGMQEFIRCETRLDILVNNAGLMACPESCYPIESKVPMSAIMSTNHLGHFILTTGLLPLLKRTAAEPGSDVRVVTVSSVAHAWTVSIDWKTSDQWYFKPSGFMGNTAAYGTTKLANILFAKELQMRFDDEGIDALSITLDPGAPMTDGLFKSLGSSWVGRWLLIPLCKYVLGITPAEGAYNSLFAATSLTVRDDKKLYAGAYLTFVGVISKPSQAASDPLAARDLWETSEKVIKEM